MIQLEHRQRPVDFDEHYDTLSGTARTELRRIWDRARMRYRYAWVQVVDLGRPDTVPASTKPRVRKSANNTQPGEKGDTYRLVLAWLTKRGPATANQIVNGTGRSYAAVYYQLSRRVDFRVIGTIPGGRNMGFRVQLWEVWRDD